MRDEYDFQKLGNLVGGAQNAANTMSGSDEFYSALMSPFADDMYNAEAAGKARSAQNYYNIFQNLFGGP